MLDATELSPMALEFGTFPPSLNGSNGLLRTHWSKRRKKLTDWTCWVLSQTTPEQRAAFRRRRVAIRGERRSVQLMDWDNLYSTFKIPLDALVRAGVLEDDGPKVVVRLEMTQRRVEKRIDQGFVMVVTPYLLPGHE